MFLVTNSFVPSKNLTVTDLELAEYDGGEAKDIPFGPQLFILDNTTGRKGVLLKEPVGGYKWICSVPPDPVKTVYGWAIINVDGDAVFFADLLPVPVPITAVGNAVEITAVLGWLENQPYGNLDGTL